MTASTVLIAPNLTAAEFKTEIIDFIKSRDFKAELLRQILSALPDDKLVLWKNIEQIAQRIQFVKTVISGSVSRGDISSRNSVWQKKFLFKTTGTPYSG